MVADAQGHLAFADAAEGPCRGHAGDAGGPEADGLVVVEVPLCREHAAVIGAVGSRKHDLPLAAGCCVGVARDGGWRDPRHRQRIGETGDGGDGAVRGGTRVANREGHRTIAGLSVEPVGRCHARDRVLQAGDFDSRGGAVFGPAALEEGIGADVGFVKQRPLRCLGGLDVEARAGRLFQFDLEIVPDVGRVGRAGLPRVVVCRANPSGGEDKGVGEGIQRAVAPWSLEAERGLSAGTRAHPRLRRQPVSARHGVAREGVHIAGCCGAGRLRQMEYAVRHARVGLGLVLVWEVQGGGEGVRAEIPVVAFDHADRRRGGSTAQGHAPRPVFGDGLIEHVGAAGPCCRCLHGRDCHCALHDDTLARVVGDTAGDAVGARLRPDMQDVCAALAGRFEAVGHAVIPVPVHLPDAEVIGRRRSREEAAPNGVGRVHLCKRTGEVKGGGGRLVTAACQRGGRCRRGTGMIDRCERERCCAGQRSAQRRRETGVGLKHIVKTYGTGGYHGFAEYVRCR